MITIKAIIVIFILFLKKKKNYIRKRKEVGTIKRTRYLQEKKREGKKRKTRREKKKMETTRQKSIQCCSEIPAQLQNRQSSKSTGGPKRGNKTESTRNRSKGTALKRGRGGTTLKKPQKKAPQQKKGTATFNPRYQTAPHQSLQAIVTCNHAFLTTVIERRLKQI